MAGRAHIVKDTPLNPSSEYKSVNVDGTLNLAQQAISAGVKRFIYLSSIKVNGEETPYGESFKPDDNPSPIDEYGKSKFEAERQDTDLKTIIMQLVKRSLGLEKISDKNIIFNDLDHLSGTWSDEEFINFTANTAGFNRIDEELWK